MEKKKSREIVMMDFSGIYREEHFYEGVNTAWVEVQGLPGSNCYCDDLAAEALREKIREFPAEGIHFIDSGNYHYMSRIWLEKMEQPFRLLVFDNHTDMQPPAFGGILSCGGWIAAALEELPLLQEVILCGPDEEAFSQVPGEWRERVRFLSREMLAGSDQAADGFFAGIPVDLPLYISIDKDVLCREDACTTWSQGDMKLEALKRYLRMVLARVKGAGGQIAGVDICGECDPDVQEGRSQNDTANRTLLELFACEWETFAFTERVEQ